MASRREEGGLVRWILALFVVSFLLVFAFPTLAVDCCIDPTTLTCTEGADLSASCVPPMTFYQGNLCAGTTECQEVCCCADPALVGGANEWNGIPSQVEKTWLECNALGTGYDPLPKTSDCVLLCSGSSGGGTTEYHTIDGTITEVAGGPVEDALVFIPFPYGTLSDTTTSTGHYEIENVPELLGTVLASKEGCIPASSASVLFDRDMTINLQINCNPTACTPLNPAIESLESIRGTDKARLTISFQDPCQFWDHFIIIRETKVDGIIIAQITIDPIIETTFEDEELEPETEYCYKVAAFYNGGFGVLPPAEQRTELCLTTGVEECLDGTTTEWCDNGEEGPRVLACDETNQMVVVETCNDGQFCTQIGSGNSASHGCVARPFCEHCNGIFGLLGSIPNLIFSVIHNYQSISCDHASLDQFCFEDQSRTTVDRYRSCGEISNCEDYYGSGACDENACGVPGDCAWSDVLIEIGKGICQATTEKADCGSCESIFGVCNLELCEAIGDNGDGTSDCYYDAAKNGFVRDPTLSKCLHADEMACRFYDTQDDCLGTSAGVVVNVLHTATGLRTGGTHTLTSTSDDRFYFGRCRWEPAEYADSDGRCYKDADGWSTVPEDDCIENGEIATTGTDCLIDSTPPATQLVIAAGVLGVHELPSIEYYVSDNFYPVAEIETHFCIGPVGSTCYPEYSLADAVLNGVNLDDDESGEFVIRYYSFDPSGNLELVQEEAVILIEQGIPWVTHAEIIG